MKTKRAWIVVGVLVAVLLFAIRLNAQNQILGSVNFSGATKVEKTSGVWVDGEYVGYLEELTGPKQVMLLPGDHKVSVRQAGYDDFTRNITVEPGHAVLVRVKMQRSKEAVWPNATVQLKIDVHPDRAAVFVDGAFAGHASEFGGAFHSMLVSPGEHHIKVELPGYRTFETDVNLIVGQKAAVKTSLMPGSIDQAGPLVKQPSQQSLQP